MKKCLFFMCALLSTMLAFSQTTVTFEQIKSSTDPKHDFNKEYDAYVASDGHTYAVGDEFTLGVPSSNKSFAYMTSELAMASAILGGGPVAYVGAQWGGYKVQIRKIKVERNKNRGAMVSMRCYLAGLGGILIQFENALNSGEIVGLGMSSDKALEELKKAKDMLDLELITQEEYDAKKEELKQYIK
ncbi:MAG: SHOCT domain-containing protein [Bacteroidales bacterium]|nr:SHOCT domain-containing protein [Bacteroidales bacterium]